MEHLLLKVAATATTDQGIFEAVISASSVDREKDVVDPDGMVRALQKWTATGKKIPLAWNHSSRPEDIIGHIDPESAKAVNGEVVVSGFIDQSTDNGQHAWRLAKSGTLGFSFGYLIPDGGATKRAGGGRNINELDVYEVTATPTPMNNDTRVLNTKSIEDLRRATNALERELEEAGLPEVKQVGDETDDATEDPVQAIRDAIEELQEFVDQERAENDPADVAAAQRLLVGLQQLLDAEAAEPAKSIDPAEQAQKATRLAAQFEREQNDRKLPDVPAATPEFAVLHITHEEMDGLAAGDLKAVWSAAFIDNLPDSAFLYVEAGGDKDPDGKTVPRSLRHFPYKDANGSIDLPHLRNALARIPQSDLPESIQESLTAKAQRILEAQKSLIAAEAPSGRSKDPLRERASAVELEFASGGESLRRPPKVKVAPAAEPELSLKELRERTRDETLRALAGVEEL